MSKLKKGKYYVGDPCYIFGKSWDKVLNDTDYFDNGEIVKVFSKDCIVGGTAYGDGIYTDNFGREYAGSDTGRGAGSATAAHRHRSTGDSGE